MVYGTIAVAIFLLGLWSVPRAEVALGPRADWRGHSKTRDHNQIVIDEVLGMLVACAPLIFMAPERVYVPIMIGFAAFRIFDITKPPGVAAFDRMKNAFGVMMDDLVAGLYAMPFVIAVAYVI